ncbi:bifunctional tRNA (5-methylaminomethyl-2-thiouridine)(34)-methyltransferase MnmD/FAD-dependent 5-carboxymethylaminomethyl-2-thiouridine(34) oxidoreductase MnmC [Azonexus sp.]|uniref:bifunctional tRNA (5-methylaminomethyl-2-thiouridine)(34)-methyltransferase MnmD/FAD-dependent 5-carboxymethylaminomethyl-2-thiouridine(34) oxidoreductase MnmC n=1 Tax=Azonexus sp. TaxID=1872668 RepID=UPI0027BB1A6D|nr:bifunctional tRNA (5-methylaminomethyl-2-thiouridine)(34)-methyltransferase MnmD/FAD-dependent 5-carboxymethylaminomethyl-2-thiouridine(34) oxidoreductase MnmC [Azonexus sp.]
MKKLQPARLEFATIGTPYSSTYDDVYHSAHGGPAQTRHVFLTGNDLPQRWQSKERFVILETGFGLGLNFLTTWQAWRNDPARCRRLHFVSFEKHPFSAADLRQAQQAWPEFAELADQLHAQWPLLTSGVHRIFLDQHRVILTLFFGDASTQLRAVNASVDAFFLDGFSPDRNPELWTPQLCKALSRLAAPGATLATWSVAGQVRTALKDAEFTVKKRPGFANKRQMLVGTLRAQRPERYPLPKERRAVVIGAGIAGCTAAYALAAAGWQVTVLEQAASPASGASCNLAGMLRPLPSADDNRLSRLTRAGFLATRRLLANLPTARWSACGVLHLGRDAEHEILQHKAVDRLGWPPELLGFIERDEAVRRLGLPVDTGGWWFPAGGWVQPGSVCQAALAAFPEQIALRCNTAVDRLERTKTIDGTETGWQLLDAAGNELAVAPVVILAAGAAAQHFEQFAPIPQSSARGQVSHLPAGQAASLPHVVFKHCYAIPEVDGQCLIGATLQYDDSDSAERLADHAENLAQARLNLPGLAENIDPASLHGRVGFRPMSPDRLPIVGALPDSSAIKGQPRLAALPRHPGLWCLQGYGARGIVWSALMADLLLSRLENEPLPLENDLVDALDPGRFLLKSCGRRQDSDNSSEAD